MGASGSSEGIPYLWCLQWATLQLHQHLATPEWGSGASTASAH